MPRFQRSLVWAAVSTALLAATSVAVADTKPGLIVDQATPVNISRLPAQLTDKPKLARMPDGALIAVYAEGVDVPGGYQVFDVKERILRNPQDIFAAYSTDDGATWSTPVNLSNTALQSSASGRVDLDGDGIVLEHEVIPWFGDSRKPNIVIFGNYVYVSWVGKYCDPFQQRTRTYNELGGVTVPFSCVYAGQIQWNPASRSMSVLTSRPLTNGNRDAINDVGAVNGNAFVVVWQEDPKGLEIGNADGPGDGASGAKVNKGTDLWMTWERHPQFSPILRDNRRRITNNFTRFDTDGDESGGAGASRPVISMVGPTVVLMYEETKGLEGFEEGKYVRYHTFDYNKLGTGEAGDDVTAGVGCILSDPLRNARRPRMLTQGASAGDTRIVFIYKQGEGDSGAPSDIMMRRAVGGMSPDKVRPPLPANCALEPTIQSIIGNNAQYRQNPAVNLSSVLGEKADSEANPIEDALAHRGVLRGKDVVIGYSYTPDQAKARYAAQENYNFYVRRSSDGGQTFSAPVNVSNVPVASGLTVREPRIVGTPGSGPRCAQDPADCQNTDALYLVYGTATNVYEQLGGSVDVDLFARQSGDFGMTFTDTVAVSAGNALAGDDDHSEDAEAQLRVSPDGSRMYVVWGTSGATSDALFRSTHLGQVETNANAVVEYYNKSLNHYFVTAFPEEAAMLDAGILVPGWSRTGQSFKGYTHDAPADAKAVCRFYGKPPTGPNSHFYTADTAECAGLKANPVWVFEGNAFSARVPTLGQCASPLLPVYRLYNNPTTMLDVNHRFTADIATYNAMIAGGWKGEGVVMCAPQ